MPGSRNIASESIGESSSSRNGSGKRTAGSVTTPASKRIRVSRACDQCRAGREKCDGIQPTCHSCELQNRSCTYNEQPKKRGIQPNYIRTLELTLAWIFRTFPKTESSLIQLLPDVQGDVYRLVSYKDASKADALHQAWRNGLVSRQIDQILSGASIEVPDPSLLNEMASTDIEDQNIIDESSIMLNILDPIPVEHASPLMEDDSSHGFDPNSTEPELLKLPEDAWSLLEHYFAFTQSWLPITEKHDILKLMYTYPAEGLPVKDVSNGDHAELWSLLALSASQRKGDAIAQSLMETAKALIPRQDDMYHLGHAKALLIQCLDELSKKAWLAAWLSVGSAVRVLTYLSSDMGQPKLLQIGRARHTFLAAFTIESAIACHIGSSTHLKRSIIHDIGLPIEDGLEEWSPWTDPFAGTTKTAKAPIMAISTFNKLAKMAEVTHDRQSLTFQNRSLLIDTIVHLVNNAGQSEHRKQPSILVADRTPVHVLDKFNAHRNSGLQTDVTPSPSDMPAWSNQGYPSVNLSHQGQTPFLSVPNASSESAVGSTPAQIDPKTDSPSVLSVGNPLSDMSQPLPFSFEAGDLFNTNIFEELASLEREDESTRPQFMQNLGFGPDLDLAEFFGADYQLSDPMLAHLQT